MNRRKLATVLLLIVVSAAATAAAVLVVWQRLDAPPSAERAAYTHQQGGELPILWPVPEFAFVDHDGDAKTRESLLGHVWVADFIFTTCTSVCPTITATLVLLQRQLSDPRLRFVSYSVDPANDTVQTLKQYATNWNATESRWLLLRPEPAQLHAFADAMHVAVESVDDPDNPITHTSMFFLVDERGDVRGVYDSSDDGALRRLRRDAGELLGTETNSPERAERDPAQLLQELSCQACHANPQVAPPFTMLASATRDIEGGTAVKVDAEYVRQSILSPGSVVARGYLKLMPSYAGQMSDAELDRLVDHLLHTAASPPDATGTANEVRPEPTLESAAELEVDPVCSMQVRVTDATPSAKHEGKDYYFCSKTCLDRFENNPSEFLDGN